MRADTPIYFQTVKKGAYDANTGDYGEPTVAEVKKYASVTDSGVETLNLVYGEIRQGSKVVRLNGNYNEPFDRIRIGRKIYRVDMTRPLRNKHIFVVSGVQ
jgi:hypothetical protein